MHASLTIRPCLPADAEYVVALKERTMRPDLERLGRWHAERSRTRVLAAFSIEHTRIIELDGEPVGSVSLRPTDEAWWLELFYLEPSTQGRGVGSAVLERLLAETDATGATVRLDVLQGSRARSLYERHGFVFDSEDEIDVFLVRRPAA
ncbi:Predicted N-acetyltransferase YhbS [Agromyces sp. CF514]|uniref:GNAT family N-acetyltransferase n=1 Tax=Agromyces sp. CF514 TaxID=1881031 RepID=UPI0008F02968|nr:GNAT family N-acetyltransferase [Agromyces sp. CF514]SFR83694.1 Predicted N-acetyltransferase YhbS [Agromyces sp. CF514]